VFLVIYFIFSLVCMAHRPNKPLVSIPFEMVGSYIVVEVRINESSRLRFILDSGVNSAIITELLPGDSVLLTYNNIRDLQGLGSGVTMNALESNGNTIFIGRKFKLFNKTIFVLQEDIFNLTRQTGTKINGLLGTDFFKDYIVQIDYTARKVRFYDKDKISVPKGYGVMPMTVEKQKCT